MNDFVELIDIYWDNPVAFAIDFLNFYPDDWQESVLMDLAAYPKTSVRSGQGVGKTGLESIACTWYLCCRPFPKVIATAPTRQQLHDVLWAEVAKWISGSKVEKLLEWTKTKIYMRGHSERWFATARTATRPENMQGFHEDYMLFIVDEASGVADPILEAILGTLSGLENKLLMCGNPTKTSGIFYDSHHADRGIYRTHKVSSLDSNRTNKENIESLIRKYGRDSNVVRVRVDGEFPLAEDDVFIPLSLIEQSVMTEVWDEEVVNISLGVDVARFGDDSTIIAPKINERVLPLIAKHGQDLMRTVGDTLFVCNKIKEKHKFAGKIYVKIDDTGLGGGVTDRLREVKKEQSLDWLAIIPINFARSVKHKYFADITTYAWGIVRDLLGFKDEEDEEGVEPECGLILPNDTELIAQLSVRKYGLSSKGKIKVESKKEMKARGIKSPDRADAVALACLPINIGNKGQRPKGGRAQRI